MNIEKKLSQKAVEQNAFSLIENLRGKLIQCPAYLQALSESLKEGANLKRPDKSIRFQVGDNLIDVIDDYLRPDAQLFTIRRRKAGKVPDIYDANNEYIHICAVLPTKNLTSSILYCNKDENISEKNSDLSIKEILKFILNMNG